jgi:DNA-binding transcriptional LysR family regulator
MELRHLRYFIAVAEHLSFSRAAKQLHIAEPPLSRQIRQLEEELGVELFLRDRRRVLLTDTGTIVLKEARTLVAQTAHLLDIVRQVKKGEAGRVRVGIGTGLADKVHRVLIEHAKRFPSVEIECQDVYSTLQNEALRERKIDVGFMRPWIDSTHLVSEALFKEPFVVLLSKSSSLAKRKKLHLKHIANDPVLLHVRDFSSGMYDKVVELYRKAGITPKIVQRPSGAFEEARAILIASGKAVYIGGGTVQSHLLYGRELSAVPLDEPGASIDVHVAWRKGEKSAAVLAFVESARGIFKHAKRADPLPARNSIEHGLDIRLKGV